MMLAVIALRNLFRNRRRTGLSLAIVSVGVTSLLLTLGFVRYSFDGLAGAIIRGGLAHFEVAPAADTPGAVTTEVDRSAAPPSLHDWRTLRARLERRPGVRAVTGSILLTGMLVNGDRTAAFLGTAIEPDRQKRMDIAVKIRSGGGLPDAAPAAGDDRILLGTDLARALGASPGDTIVAMVSTPDGSLNAVDMIVAGLATTGLKDLDARMAEMHLATAQRLLSTEDVTSLLVGLNEGADMAAIAPALRQDLAAAGQQLELADWQSRAPYYGQVRGLYLGIFVFLGAIIGLLITLSTSNTLQMSVMERVREFGMLLAIGTDRRQLAGLVTLEAVWLAILGAFTGSLLTVVASTAINALHIQMPPPPGAVDPVDLAVAIRPIDFAGAALFMLVLLVAATAPPMVRILRLQVAEALTHV
jgi:putative ABC transport system permease protein